MLEELDVPLCTSLHLVFPTLRSVAELLDISTSQLMLFMTMILMTFTLMACPSLMTHLVATCGRMPQVMLNLVVSLHHLVLVLIPVQHSHHLLWGTIISGNLGM